MAGTHAKLTIFSVSVFVSSVSVSFVFVSVFVLPSLFYFSSLSSSDDFPFSISSSSSLSFFIIIFFFCLCFSFFVFIFFVFSFLSSFHPFSRHCHLSEDNDLAACLTTMTAKHYQLSVSTHGPPPPEWAPWQCLRNQEKS